MKKSLTLAAAVAGLLAAPAASFAGGLVPGSGADFTETPVVATTPAVRSDDKVSTGSIRTYGSQSNMRRNVVDQKQKAEEDSGFTERRSLLVPGSGADFTK